MALSQSYDTTTEFTPYQLDHLRHIVQTRLAATQAVIDADGPVDHPLTDRLLLEISILERIDEARLQGAF